MANEPLKGKRIVEVTENKTKKDWAIFIKRIADEHYPKAKKITLVMDNFKTHAASAFYETFKPVEAKRLWERFEFVYTPKHGSWLSDYITDVIGEFQFYHSAINGSRRRRTIDFETSGF